MPAREVVRRIEATAISPTGARDERTGAGIEIVDPYLALTSETVEAPAPRKASAEAVRVLPVPTDPRCSGPRGRRLSRRPERC